MQRRFVVVLQLGLVMFSSVAWTYGKIICNYLTNAFVFVIYMDKSVTFSLIEEDLSRS